MTPEVLARELGISAKTLRTWLRHRWPRAEKDRGKRWSLTDQHVSEARARWSSTSRQGPSDLLPSAGAEEERAVAGLRKRLGVVLSDSADVEDIGAVVQQALRESYLGQLEDLRFYANKVKFFNELKRQLRDTLTHLDERRVHLSITDGSDRIDPIPRVRFVRVKHPNGGGWEVEQVDAGVVETVKELDIYIKSLEGQLATVGDDAQLANIDMQNKLQQHQQTLQTMSNVSKMLHDTLMAIIRKIG